MVKPKNDNLTERELQVVKLLAVGRTRGEIATSLDISIKTVDTHHGNVVKKIGVRNTVELARHALRVGWVTLEQEAA